MIRIGKHRTQEISKSEALLLDDIQKTRDDLALAYANFEYVVDPDLIDSCIYQVNAVQLRYKFLLNRAKQLEHLTPNTRKNLEESSFYARNPLELSGSYARNPLEESGS